MITGDRDKPNDLGIYATPEQQQSFKTKIKAFNKSDALFPLFGTFLLVDMY